MNKRMSLKTLAALTLAMFAAAPAAYAADNVLKIGVNGVMSGAAASWGQVNKYCAETTAEMYNAKGGVDIGGKKYKIEIVALDDKNDPKISISNAEKLASDGKNANEGTSSRLTDMGRAPTFYDVLVQVEKG